MLQHCYFLTKGVLWPNSWSVYRCTNQTSSTEWMQTLGTNYFCHVVSCITHLLLVSPLWHQLFWPDYWWLFWEMVSCVETWKMGVVTKNRYLSGKRVPLLKIPTILVFDDYAELWSKKWTFPRYKWIKSQMNYFQKLQENIQYLYICLANSKSNVKYLTKS